MYFLEESSDYSLHNIENRSWEYSDITFWTNPKDGCCNATIEYCGRSSRLRAGIIILDGNKVLLCEEDEPGVFSIPGGGLEEDESPLDAAVREAREEVYINVKNAVDIGLDYCECHNEVKPWVKENVPKSKWWYNYYTCLVVAEYESKYRGKIDSVDKDYAVKNSAAWYDLDEVINKPSFKKQWKRAIELYRCNSLKEDICKVNNKWPVAFVVNSEDNPNLANTINTILKNYKPPYKVTMRRDNCGAINSLIRDELRANNIDAKLTWGYFIVDNVNLVDAQDLGHLHKYADWKASGESMPSFVERNNYFGKDKRWFTYIPHCWLVVKDSHGDLIVDGAGKMFTRALTFPITADRYSLKDFTGEPHALSKFNEGPVSLEEDTRWQLTAASRNAGVYKNKFRGKNRWERRRFSKVSSQTQKFNTIDMNKFFKEDLLEVNIPVTGETAEYQVTIQMDKVCEELRKCIKNNKNIFEYKCIIQAITKIFNTSNIRMKCNCSDFKYRFAHWSIINNYGVDDTAHDPGPGKGVANPNNDKGKGCKHCLAVLSNQDWAMKVASVIKNYILYMAEHKKQLFNKFIFQKLYGIPADEAKEQNLVPEETSLNTDKNIINTINDWAKNRGKFKKGENKNPSEGKGKLAGPKEDNSVDEADEDESAK